MARMGKPTCLSGPVSCSCRTIPFAKSAPAFRQHNVSRQSFRLWAEEQASERESGSTTGSSNTDSSSPANTRTSRTPYAGWAAAGAVGLGIAAFVATRVATGSVTLSTLEQASTPLDTALQNQRPTVVEFYANWCEVCRELTPDIYKVEQEFKDRVNFVMLNIENSKWAPEVAEYQVGGIPHFVFLDDHGRPQAAAVGRLPRQVLEKNVLALAAGEQLPFRGASGATSSIAGRPADSMAGPGQTVSPRSHD